MKRYSIVLVIFAVIFLALSPKTYSQVFKKKNKRAKTEIPTVMLSTNQDTISYIIGADIAKNFKNNGIEINLSSLIEGLKAGHNGYDTLFSVQQIQNIMMEWQQKEMKKQEELAKENIEKNKKLGQDFLDANKAKDGVIVTESGLQYKIIKQGEGESPSATDIVKVHYKGTLIDGTQFDSSYDRGEPTQFPLNRVIKGWTEGLQLMKPGAHFIFYIPSELAYGDHKTGNIPEASTLIFEVELLEVIKQ
ncbi:MAG: FKBP-type peptidyl-prolyl cis-trans isomerase [Bacteroidales bacterium]|jgi:FKBP-type peptidyl-prolyl cis-trans isomerase FkpA